LRLAFCSINVLYQSEIYPASGKIDSNKFEVHTASNFWLNFFEKRFYDYLYDLESRQSSK
jgi:hypothetical protein